MQVLGNENEFTDLNIRLTLNKHYVLQEKEHGNEVHKPGHTIDDKQTVVVTELPVQPFPPFEGAGLVHDLWRLLVPPPQVT